MSIVVDRESRLLIDGKLVAEQGYLDLAVEEGGSCACGGGPPADRDTGFFIEPTVISGLTNDARVGREEIFGPVLTAIAHDGDAGVAARMRVGTVNVDGGIWYSADAPFGGYKQSGIGREMGLAGFEEYTEIKLIATMA
jgi:aldehyde dehydrogenase (NAD+)